MMTITFPWLYMIYGAIIGLVCLSTVLSQYYQSERLFHGLCSICAFLSIYLPILLKYHFVSVQFSDALVSIFSAVIGFLFSMKILEISFTYEWSQQKYFTIKQILIDFSTFPKYKYQSEPSFSSTLIKSNVIDDLDFLLFGNREDKISPRRRNFLIIIRGLFQYSCLRLILHFTPDSMLRLHSRYLHLLSISHFLIYNIYAFILYFSLGMVINLVFGIMGVFWNITLCTIYPGYPFLPISLHDFWSRRWNIYIKTILQRLTFIALPKLIGVSNKSRQHLILAGFSAFFVSGLLHEFMYSVSMDRWSGGKNMIFFMLHGILVGLELTIKAALRRKQLVHPFVGWICTVIILYCTSSLFFDPWIESDCFVLLKKYLG